MFKVNIDKIYENYIKYTSVGKVFYPVKANSNEKILRILKDFIFDDNSKFYISSREHFDLLTEKLKVNPEKIAVMNPLMSKNLYVYLYMKGVRFFVFDDIEKLDNFLLYANMKDLELCFRINTMEICPNVVTNLGTDIKTIKQMIDKCQEAKQLGVSVYFNPELKQTRENYLDDMLKIIPNNINFVSIGGIPCFENNKNKIEAFKEEREIDIIFEPGKGLLENTMDLETDIIKKTKNIITIKHGIYSGFLDILLYNKEFELYFIIDDKTIPIYNNPAADRKIIYLFGGSADSADKLGIWYINKNYYDKIDINTKLLIKNVGTYFEEFSMKYGKRSDLYEI